MLSIFVDFGLDRFIFELKFSCLGNHVLIIYFLHIYLSSNSFFGLQKQCFCNINMTFIMPILISHGFQLCFRFESSFLTDVRVVADGDVKFCFANFIKFQEKVIYVLVYFTLVHLIEVCEVYKAARLVLLACV